MFSAIQYIFDYVPKQQILFSVDEAAFDLSEEFEEKMIN